MPQSQHATLAPTLTITPSAFQGVAALVQAELIARLGHHVAHVNAEATLILDPDDPFRFGIG